jgi:UDP-glucose 4-epimerase
MKKVLILGGTGYIGTNLAVYLCNEYDVTVTGRENINKILNQNNNIKFLKLKLSDLHLINDIVDIYDIFIMLIPNTQPHNKVPNNEYELEEIINPTKQLFNLLVSKNKKIVFSSTGGAVYGDSGNKISKETDFCLPLNSYGEFKLELENHLQMLQKSSELNAAILRISNPYGGNFGGYFKSGFINNALHKLVLNSTINIWGDGQQIRDYIHILDLCECIKRVLEISKFQLINIGTGKGSNLINIVDEIFNVFGKKLNLAFDYDYFEKVSYNVLDIKKSEALLSYSPKFDLTAGLEYEKNFNYE